MRKKDENLERRCLRKMQLRFDETGDSPKIVGTAAVFDTWADIGGMFKESIAPGAFKKSLKESDIRALWNHNSDYVLGRNKAGTLRLHEDDKGLQVEIDPPDSVWARDLMASMKRQDVNQMSFGFTVNKADDDYDENTRVLRDVNLFDISVVSYPAYETTTAEVRSAFQGKSPKISNIEVEELDGDEFNALDEAIRKIKAKEELTEDDHRALIVYLPPSEQPGKHSEDEAEQPGKHSDEDTREKDVTKMLLTKAEYIAPAKK